MDSVASNPVLNKPYKLNRNKLQAWNTTRSDAEGWIWEGTLKDYCKDTDEASDVFSVSHNSASIITPYANGEEVGNYSQTCFILPVLPDLRLKCNSARLHRQYRAKTHRQTGSNGLCWIWGQGLGRQLQKCWLRNSLSRGLHLSRGEGIPQAAPLPYVFKQWDEAAHWNRQPTKCRICQTVLSGGILRLVTWEILFLRTLSWGTSSSSFFSLHIHQDQSSWTIEPNSGNRCFTLITCETTH